MYLLPTYVAVLRDRFIDWRHVVASMCRMGCDRLFEQGYITVAEGRVVARNLDGLATDLREHLLTLDGQPCSHWGPGSRAYYDWHAQQFVVRA